VSPWLSSEHAHVDVVAHVSTDVRRPGDQPLSAVLNGIVSAPVMAMLMMLATSRNVMGRFRISTRLAIGGWAATVVMGAASIGLLLSTLPLFS